MCNRILDAREVKNGSATVVFIRNKKINCTSSLQLDIKEEICIGRLLCYEVDQDVNEEIFVKSELEELLGKKFDIMIEDNDIENTYNNTILIKNCYMYKYSHFIMAGNIRMMQYEFSFLKENKQKLVKSYS